MRETWIIIMFNSEGACSTSKAFGTREEMHELVLSHILADAAEDEEHWDYGTESVYDFEVYHNNGFIGCNCFYDYSINYVAYPYTDIPELKEDNYVRSNYDSYI